MSRFLISFIGITLKNLQQSFLNLSLKFAIFLANTTVYSVKDILTLKKAFYNRHMLLSSNDMTLEIPTKALILSG